MNVELDLPVSPPPEDPKKLAEYLYKFIAALGDNITILLQVLNGQLTFGDGTDSDNMHGVWATVTTSGTPGAEVAVTHNLGTIPVGFLVMVPPLTGTINRGPTAWTTTQIFLSGSAATQTVTIFILAGPKQNL